MIREEVIMATRRKRQNPFRNAATYGNVAYDERFRSNTAWELEEPEQEQQRREEQRLSDTRLRRAKESENKRTVAIREQQRVSIFAIVGFFVAAVLAVSVLSSYVQLNSIYASTVAAQTTLSELKTNYAKLEAEDEEIFDSETLQKAADEAGLVKPSASQQVYLEMSEPDNTVVYQQQEEVGGIQGCWNAIVDFFGGLGAYFS
jgi:cell division protein FtsL